jgi:DNA-binding MarR family transcriptional regulator
MQYIFSYAPLYGFFLAVSRKERNMSVNTKNDYFKVTRLLCDEEHQITPSAFKVFCWLNELEQRAIYARRTIGSNPTTFTCTDKELCEKVKMDIKTVQRAKKELKELGLIKVTRGNWHYTRTGKSDIKQPCVYEIT